MIRELNCDDYNQYLNLISEFRKTNFSKEDFTNFLKNNKNIERCTKLKCYKITLYCNSQITKFYQECGLNNKGIQMEYRF